jgi:hypothetical protein
LSARWKTLHIVTPDSNVATIKRLRGIGIATGIIINPVGHIRDLPNPPQDNSIVLISNHMLSDEISLGEWPNVFVICRDDVDNRDIKHSKILVSRNLDLSEAWLEVTSLLVKHIIKNPGDIYWHSVRHTISGNPSKSAADLFEWLKNYKYLNMKTLGPLLKIIESLAPVNTHRSQENIEIKISMDCQKIRLNIYANNIASLTNADTSLLINNLQDCPELILTSHAGLQIYTSLSLTTKKHPRFVFLVNEAFGHAFLRHISREAS